MLLEALVFTVCVQGSEGCSETTSAYYKQSTFLQDLNSRVEHMGKEIIGNKEWIVYVGTPVYAVLSRKPAKFLIYEGTILNVDPWTQSVGLQWNY